MEQSKQLVSRELAERMRELGFEQRSLFYWVGKEKDNLSISNVTTYIYGSAPDLAECEYPFVYSAYTVAELGEMLKARNGEIYEFCTKGKWNIQVRGVWIEKSDTEADARAKMLIYLAEQGIINPKEIKI